MRIGLDSLARSAAVFLTSLILLILKLLGVISLSPVTGAVIGGSQLMTYAIVALIISLIATLILINILRKHHKALSELGIIGYGFSPLKLPADLDFMALFHGVDERVPVEGLKFGVNVLESFLRSS